MPDTTENPTPDAEWQKSTTDAATLYEERDYIGALSFEPVVQ